MIWVKDQPFRPVAVLAENAQDVCSMPGIGLHLKKSSQDSGDFMSSDKALDDILLGPADRTSPCAACDVREVSICAVLDPDELKRLEKIGTRLAVQQRETIFREADPAEYLFNVTGGAVKVYKLLADGRRQITGFFFPGDFLGLAHLNKYAYTAEAIEDVRLCRFSRYKLENMLEQYPKLERHLLQTASNELASAQDQMLLLGRKTARERIATFLLALSEQARRHGRSGERVNLPMSRGDIGDYLGLTMETVSRTFTRFKNDGKVELTGARQVTLQDRQALCRLAGLVEDEPVTAVAASL